VQPDAGVLDPVGEVAQGLVELLLARDLLREVELPADLGGGVEEVHLVAALGQGGRRCQAGGSGADDGDPPAGRGRGDHEVTLMARARVDQAGDRPALERVVQARLVARDAGVDPVRPARSRLRHEERIGQQRSGHADHVRRTLGQHLLGHVRGVDPVGGDQRDVEAVGTQLGAHPLRDPRERRPRHAGGDRGHPRLMPADPGVDDRRACCSDRPGQRDGLLPRAAVRDQVEHGQAVDDDEVRPHGLARAAHDLDRQAHPVRVRPAPAVGALVGVGDQELVDEVALGAHDLDTVVAGLARQGGAVDEGLDLALDAALAQGARGEGGDRALDPRRGDHQRVVAVATGVQDLQRDVAALGVHRVGDRHVLAGGAARGQGAGAGLGPALDVRREPAGHDQPDPSAGAFGEVVREVGEALGVVLQPGVHRAHQHAVAQGGEPQVERGEQVRVGRGIRGRHGSQCGPPTPWAIARGRAAPGCGTPH
jgi:hypothetical protein